MLAVIKDWERGSVCIIGAVMVEVVVRKGGRGKGGGGESDTERQTPASVWSCA